MSSSRLVAETVWNEIESSHLGTSTTFSFQIPIAYSYTHYFHPDLVLTIDESKHIEMGQ